MADLPQVPPKGHAFVWIHEKPLQDVRPEFLVRDLKL